MCWPTKTVMMTQLCSALVGEVTPTSFGFEARNSTTFPGH